MKKTTSVWEKIIMSCACLALILQMTAPQAIGQVLKPLAGEAETYDTTDITPTQPKFRFDMETLEEGKVSDSVSETTYTVNGSAVLIDGHQGEKALEFNGSDTYINLGTAFQPTNAYTMMGWVKQAPNPTDGQAIFYRGNSGITRNQLGVIVKSDQVYHAVAVGSTNSTFREMYSPAKAPTEQWNHIAVTRSGETVLIYINGVLEHTGSINGADFVVTDYPMYIGIDSNSSGTPYNRHAFKGAMDDLRLYDVVVPADEIAAIYQAERLLSIVDTATENGKVVVNFLKNPASVNESEVTLSATIDSAATAVNIIGLSYDALAGQATINFEPLESQAAGEKTAVLSVSYKGEKQTTSFVLLGSNNKVPTAENLSVKNLSTSMLGEVPHVKGMLEAKYTFVDEDGDEESNTKFQWQVSDSADGPFEDILGIRTRTVILLDKYEGKYLRCKVMPVDEFGNKGTDYFTSSTIAPVQPTEGNPLTDWFYKAEYGIAHHFLSNYFNLSHVYTSPEEMWDRKKMTWNEFVGQFDAEAYAKQINDVGAKFVLLTLGQNSGSYCAPNAVYDKYLREAGLLGEGEANPKTTSMENDLPMRIADALEPYGIKLMLYLPSNPPHSACWDETGTPNGYGYFSDYLVTTKVFDYTPGVDGTPNQRARKVHNEMVEWWSRHYGDKVAGWWFDGFYSNIEAGQKDMTQEYNISTMANAAKAGNPYSIITFNRGTGQKYTKSSDYTDYTAGENTGLSDFSVDGRWANGTDDCQNYMWGPLGNRGSWSNGWGCSGLQFQDVNRVISTAQTALEKQHVIGFDVRVNIFGAIDPQQYDQLHEVHDAIKEKPVLVSVTTPTIVATLGANLAITALGENLDGRTLTAYLKVGDDLLYPTVLTNDKGMMKITKAPDVAGDYKLIVKVSDSDDSGECRITVTKYNIHIWTATPYTLEGKLFIKFNEGLTIKTATNCVTISGKTYNAAVLADKRTVEVLGLDAATLVTDTTVSIKGVKYPLLFPSYSFTFTVECIKDYEDLTVRNLITNGAVTSSEEVTNLVDGNTSTKWYTGHRPLESAPLWVTWNYSTPVTIDSIGIATANDSDGRDPCIWTLSGSNDGTEYTVFYFHSSNLTTARRATAIIELPEPVTYKYYKLEITATRTANNGCQLSEFLLHGNFNR